MTVRQARALQGARPRGPCLSGELPAPDVVIKAASTYPASRRPQAMMGTAAHWHRSTGKETPTRAPQSGLHQHASEVLMFAPRPVCCKREATNATQSSGDRTKGVGGRSLVAGTGGREEGHEGKVSARHRNTWRD